MIEPSAGACAGALDTGSSSGTVSAASVGAVTTGAVTFVPSGPVKTDIGVLGEEWRLVGIEVVTWSTSLCPARRWWAIAKPGSSMA